ncbi:recombinase family protein [Nocardia sp. NPDC019219]|uniref:recombinase family protein n=1 Tax=Nocardia sp. NPDC019219 TaxID=3154590 RepID=UPI00340FF3F2
MTPPLRALIYVRVSSDNAGGRSVEEQEAECRAVCERNGWPVEAVFSDNDRSASRYATKDRPEYARLKKTLTPGDVLVTWEASRAQRELGRYVELRDLCAELGVFWSYNGKLFDLTKGDDRFATGLDALLSEKEADQIRDRIMRAHRANLAAGRPHGRVPYGYRVATETDANGRVLRKWWEPEPIQSALIAEAARRVLDGQSFGSTVRWMETKDPRGWDSAKLRRLLVNPTLAGFRTHSEVVNGKRGRGVIHGKGTWEAILTEDQHNDLVALFAARKSGPRGVPVKYLASGIATCSVCKEPVWRRWGGKSKVDGRKWPVYGCKKMCVARTQDIVDDAVHAVVEGILTTPEALEALAEAPATDPTAGVRLAELRRQLEEVETEIAEGRMPAATGARVATRLEAQITEAEAAAAPTFIDPAVKALATAPDPVKMWRGLDLVAQREFIKAVLVIEIERIGKGRWADKRKGINITPRSRPAA